MYMKNKKISIIVPIYNMEKYLENCIETILKQEYTNFELILVNDGSTDNSGSICDKYSSNDERIKVIHKKNGGVSSSRNVGIEEATGEYLGFIDPDDYLHPKMYLKLVENIEKFNADLSICGNYDVYENGKISHVTSDGDIEVIDSNECIRNILNEKKYLGTCWNKLYKKELFDNVKFNVNRRISEDLEVLMEVIPKCDKIVYDPTPLYYWVIHNNSTIHSKFVDNIDKWNDEIQLCKTLVERYEQQGSELLDYAIKRYIRINEFCVTRLVYEKKSKNIIKNYRKVILKYYNKFMKFDFVKKTYKIKIFLIKLNPKLIVVIDLLCLAKAKLKQIVLNKNNK